MGAQRAGWRMADAQHPLRCGLLISGSGTGMEAMIRAQQALGLAHQTVVVVSNKADVEGVGRATNLNVPCAVVEQTIDGVRFTREEHEAKVSAVLEAYDVEWVVLCGYMRLLSPGFIERWNGKVVNIHPSYLPHFPGAHAHRDVLAAGTTVTGCTVHLVDEGMDTGPILGQSMVPVFPDDTETTLSHRVKVEEHRLYPEILSLIASGHPSHQED